MQKHDLIFDSVTDLITHINTELDWESPIDVPERPVIRTVNGTISFIGYREPIIEVDPDYGW
jgi:hypothetical protein